MNLDWNTLLAALLTALLGGGGLGGLIGAFGAGRKNRADIARSVGDTLTQSVITPLRDELARQERQIRHLEAQQDLYFESVAYTRELCHWLDPAVRGIDPEYMARHPKPRLPDSLRAEIAPETIDNEEEK